MEEGLKRTILIYILTWIWSTYNQVLRSLLCGPSSVPGTHTSREPSQAEEPAGPQSHISSGSSWGLRIPGTDICSLCFSS